MMLFIKCIGASVEVQLTIKISFDIFLNFVDQEINCSMKIDKWLIRYEKCITLRKIKFSENVQKKRHNPKNLL